ncbi:mCG144485, partial [Mus musculus]
DEAALEKKFKLIHGQWTQGCASNSKHTLGLRNNIQLSQRLMTMEEKVCEDSVIISTRFKLMWRQTAFCFKW